MFFIPDFAFNPHDRKAVTTKDENQVHAIKRFAIKDEGRDAN
jgi:hypothetical protein